MTQKDRKCALVTGASMGIGRGIAVALAKEGYDLAITHLDEKDKAKEVASLIETQHGGRCFVLQGDLSEPDIPLYFVDEAVRELGKIDVLVNNAGRTILSKITDMSLKDIDYLLHLNFRGPILMIQAAARHMIAAQIRGSIVNISSSRSQRAYPPDSVYGGTKAALMRATESIALELSTYGIRVNCVAPGMIKVRDTNQEYHEKFGRKIPLSRVGLPEDIGRAVAWLCSESASYITGISLRVDGGLTLPGMPENLNMDPELGWGRI